MQAFVGFLARSSLIQRASTRLTEGIVGPARLLSRPHLVLALLAGFYLIMLGLQVALQTGGRNDDAELMLFGQALRLGYDPKNPPLLAWMTWLAMQLLGPSYLAVRLVVLSCLVLTYVALHGAARHAIRDSRLALAAALAPATMLYLAWNPFINLTHTLGLAALCAATLWALLAYLSRPRLPAAVLLGLAVGCGLLAKYNFSIFLTGLVLALLLVPRARRTVRWADGLVAAGLALAIAGPHYVWLFLHRGAAAEVLAGKWGLSAAQDWLTGVVSGLAAMTEASFNVLMPMAGILLLLFWYALLPVRRGPRSVAGGAEAADRPSVFEQTEPLDPERYETAARLVGTTALCALLIVLGAVLLLEATRFRIHHFVFLVTLPIWLFALVERRGGARVWSLNLYALTVAGCLLAVCVSYFGWIATNARGCTKCSLLLPYETYAEGLRAAGFTPGTVLILGPGDFLPAEQMRPWLPEARYLRPEHATKHLFVPAPAALPGDCVVVWDSERFPDSEARLRSNGLRGYPAFPESTRFGRIAGEIAWSGRAAPAMGYALVEDGLGDCR